MNKHLKPVRNDIIGLLLCLSLVLIGLTVFAADSFTIPTQALRGTAPISQDLTVTNVNDTVGLTVNKPATNNASLLELRRGGTIIFAVPTNGAPGIRQYVGIKSGTVVTAADGTVTNTFSPVFTNAPVILTTQLGEDTTITNVVVVATNYFILNTHKAGQTNNWIAIGAQ